MVVCMCILTVDLLMWSWLNVCNSYPASFPKSAPTVHASLPEAEAVVPEEAVHSQRAQQPAWEGSPKMMGKPKWLRGKDRMLKYEFCSFS